jgi:dipeptidyl aminopeptidase/acylaminoacyl peptidase
LNHQWGVLDVSDCIAAAQYLVDSGEVDADKVAIRGSSAGGYTVLAALCFHSYFHAGVSYYGISDMVRLYRETHKFESHYIDRLIGRYPEDEALFQQRSPLVHYQSIDNPVLFLQGREDKVVPPNQAQMMHQALCDKGIKSELIIFDYEGHGFREEKNIADALQRELSFYQQVFKLTE